jgi:hypothetical protein
MYVFLHVLHLSWYIPPGLALLSFGDSCWYILLDEQKAIFRLVCLNKLVTFRTEGLWYVKLTHLWLFGMANVECELNYEMAVK